MGYRSNVTLLMNKNGVIKFMQEIKALEEGRKVTVLSLINEALIRVSEEGNVSLDWEWVKWYNSYPEVAFVNDFVDNCVNNYNDNINDDIYVGLAMVGEEFEDISLKETDWHQDLNLTILRTISFNDSGMEERKNLFDGVK